MTVVLQVAYDIIGGGEEGDKRRILSKEEADHSLPYMIAVALLDRQVQPQQYAPERIVRPDVQALLHKVTVTSSASSSDPAATRPKPNWPPKAGRTPATL